MTEFFAPKMQPVWHHLAWTQRFRSIASGTRSQVCPALSSVAAHSPPDFDDLVPGRALHAQRRLGARVVGVERRAADLARPHAPVGPSSGRWSRRSKVSRGRAQRRGQVEVRAAADAVADARSARPGPGPARRCATGARCPSTAGSRCAGGGGRARAPGCSGSARRRGRARPAGRRRSSRRSRSRRCRRRRARPSILYGRLPLAVALARQLAPVGVVGVAVRRVPG